jgi:hypothetical protein
MPSFAKAQAQMCGHDMQGATRGSHADFDCGARLAAVDGNIVAHRLEKRPSADERVSVVAIRGGDEPCFRRMRPERRSQEVKGAAKAGDVPGINLLKRYDVWSMRPHAIHDSIEVAQAIWPYAAMNVPRHDADDGKRIVLSPDAVRVRPSFFHESREVDGGDRFRCGTPRATLAGEGAPG